MKLTLVPPPSFPIPPSLHSHFVDPPTEAKLRTSPSTSQARDIQLLRRLGVQIDSPLALDKAAWLPSTAVEEVVWDFEQEEVVVLMWDGTSTRWGFDERGMLGLSEEFISDGDEDEIMSSQDPNSAPRGATRASEIYDRLYSLCVELRSAYEDVGTPSPGLFVAGEPGVPLCADSTFDFSELLELSSDPALKFPFEWSAASSQVEWFLDDPDVPPPSRRTSARLASHNSASGDDPDDQVESLLLESRSRTGQLPSRCRPTSFDLLVPDPSQRGSHDFLSFVSLLSQTRHTLLDIFSLVIVPALQSRLHPTFATWVAASAEKECLRLAVRKAAELAQLFEGLLADDGNTFDPNDGEDEESEMFSSQEDLRTGYHAEDHESQSSSSDTDIDAEFEEDLGHKLWSSLQESTATRKSKKLKRNVMAAMRDDYALVEWCERRRDRAREDAREDSREGSPRTNVLTTQVIPRWEASRPYPVDGKDIPSSPTLKSGWDASDDLSDDDDDGSIGEGRSIFFHPTDSTGLDLLPYRLPKGLLRTAQGFEMERMRKKANTLLNEIAGLQKRIMELRTFVEVHLDEWEDGLALDFAIENVGRKLRKSPLQNELKETTEEDEKPGSPKVAKSTFPKALRRAQGSSSKVPRKPTSPKSRPLRCVTGDKVVGNSVQAVLKDAKLNSPPGKKRAAKATSPSPRTRKNANLEAINSVRALLDVEPETRSPLGGVVATSQLRPAAARILPPPSPSPTRGKKRKAEDDDSTSPRQPPSPPGSSRALLNDLLSFTNLESLPSPSHSV